VKVLLGRLRGKGKGEEQKKEKEKEEKKMVREAKKRWERAGRSPDFLRGRMYVGGRETRM